ncbi:hypothetical protein [Paenibacillus harenae]|uniref:hypothetical protein n=1 Tax=Paenibacillus harenae TaxID=306543 RepID=UPI00278E9C90|nr:hypothetical protein [Paenibacillus harenae]MDQ0060029.1 hypothetical protein [Paenibacillus harenae]
MRATPDVLSIWRKFDHFPMETITKAWFFHLALGFKQRTVEQMKSHREQYGTSGNCFDLAIWLIHEFRKEKFTSYAILTPDSHVAVVVLNEKGNRYLCDLGDQWIDPILIDQKDEDYSEEFLDNFFPGAQVKMESRENSLLVTYRRPNGKEMNQTYLLNPITDETLIAEGEKTQRTLSSPLVEKRIFTNSSVIHWEFDNYISFYSSMDGKQIESKLQTIEEWAERIGNVSGIDKKIIRDALEVYSKKSPHN